MRFQEMKMNIGFNFTFRREIDFFVLSHQCVDFTDNIALRGVVFLRCYVDDLFSIECFKNHFLDG